MSNHSEFNQFLGQQASQTISATGAKGILGAISGSASWNDTQNKASSYAAKQRGLVVAVNIKGWKPGTSYAKMRKEYGPLGKIGGYARKSNCGGTLQYDFAIYGPPASASGSPAYQGSGTPQAQMPPASSTPYPMPTYQPQAPYPHPYQPSPQYQPAPYNPYPTIPSTNPYNPYPAPNMTPAPYYPNMPAQPAYPSQPYPSPQAPNPYPGAVQPRPSMPMPQQQFPGTGENIEANNMSTPQPPSSGGSPGVADILAPVLDKLFN